MKRDICFFFHLFVIGVLFSSQDVCATSYVTFNDGRLYVFPDTCLESVTEEDGCVLFTALDGMVYSYPTSSIQSIDEQPVKELPAFTTFKFDNKYNYQVYTDAEGTIAEDEVNVVVAAIGKRLTASFTLSDENARAYVDGREQESTVSRLRFENSRSYVVGYPGDLILARQATGGYGLIPYGRPYEVNVDFLTDHSTAVPRIDVNTVGGVPITSKTVYVDAEIIIDGAGVFPSMTDSVKIKGRGNTSWSSNPNAKNPYRLKFAEKVKPLGLTKGKSWVLLANKTKGSMLTNAVGMKVGSLIGVAATNHMVPVDLYVNGVYKGSYNFTEKLGLSNNSVDVDDEAVATFLELDAYYDEAAGQKFRSTPFSLPVNIREPEFAEGGTELTLNLIKQRFNSFVADVKNYNDFSDHADVEYLARYLMANELTFNTEIIHPKSVYCYHPNILDDSCKFVFGPLWDFDWAYGFNSTHKTYFVYHIDEEFYHWAVEQLEFIKGLRYGSDTGEHLYRLWNDFMVDKLDELCEFCVDYYQYAAPSFEKNKQAGLDDTDYAAQAVQAAYWLRERANIIYQRIKAEFAFPGDVDGDGILNINDVTTLINYLLTHNSDLIDMYNADVDGDGIINIGDVTTLINKLLTRED